MHCPRCGQKQVSEDIKFCSRCGFPLGLVAEILAYGGFLPQLADLNKNKKWLTQKNGLKFGLAWFLITTFLLVPLAAVTDAPDDIVAFLAIVGFAGGLLIMLCSWLFLTKVASSSNQSTIQNEAGAAQFLRETQAQTALPPQTSQPIESYMPPASSWKAPDTGELTRPGSVIENTTKLLKREK